MKKYFGLIAMLVVCLLAVMSVSAADTTVYLNDGGTGDGSSASAPLGDIVEAINKAANGGKIVITDTYTMLDAIYEPTHKGDIVITGGTFDLNAETFNRYYLAGPGSTTFENINLHDASGDSKKGLVVIAQFNELIMGEGVDTMTTKTYLIGGFQVPFEENIKLDLDSHITIKSGKYHVVSGSSRGASSTLFAGTSHIVMDGGEVNMLLGGSCNGSAMGGADITINGGTINQLMMAGDVTRRINGDATLTVNGGLIGQLLVNNIMGHATVNFNGGQIASATKSIEDKIQEFVTDGTATLNVNPDLNAAMVALAFDNVNYVGGKTPAATTEPAKTTTEAPVKTEEPVTTEETKDAAATEASTASETTEAVTTEPAKTEPAETTTEAEKTTDTEKAADTTVPATTAAPAPADEGGLGTGTIIGIVVAAIVVIAVVVVVIVKKKK